jgi:L,D-peptidoglycan transpeptidase YkuD (ErfK/YbiS/YcfS/YnhG family)
MDMVLTRIGSSFALDWGAGARRCAVGRSGVGIKLREGDGITPIGRWPLRRVLYRADRLATPQTALPCETIAQHAGWCDAPEDKNYNGPVTLPYPASAEALWREDALYDALAVLGFNDDPVMPGKGSAIFLHIAKPDYAPTEGCLALSREDLLAALALARPGDCVLVKA